MRHQESVLGSSSVGRKILAIKNCRDEGSLFKKKKTKQNGGEDRGIILKEEPGFLLPQRLTRNKTKTERAGIESADLS